MRASEWVVANRYSRLAIGRAHAAQRSRLHTESDTVPLPSTAANRAAERSRRLPRTSSPETIGASSIYTF
ncbi:unnamed protein product [Euphydryas editha]|uniref:Uncharacterized protein n=1 Tax=Euphydryas editha TaxID=104508 RepID=A0AAU9TYM8_EUPED|nr:unnamed protein product [Euphydryas editha]